MRLALLALPLLTACVVSEDTTGHVKEVGARTVTIQGAFSADGSAARPTAAMVAQAQEICPGAKYLSATATPGNLDTFDYLFLCK
jgi:hypothetical protein